MTRTWPQIARTLARSPHDGHWLVVSKDEVVHPLDAGFRHTMGVPVGQRADFSLRLPRWRLHVRDMRTHYEVQLFGFTNPPLRTSRDPTQPVSAVDASSASAAALGALVGLAIGRTAESAVAGSLVGVIVGLCAAGGQATSTRNRPRRSARRKRK